MLGKSSVSADARLSPAARKACIAPAESVALGKDRIRYFLYLYGRWRWRPTKTMREHGFNLVTMSRGGPGLDTDGYPEASIEDRKRAIGLNDAWDRVRSGQASAPARTTLASYPPGSVGDGYQRSMSLRKAERLAKGIIWTNEQESRDDWPRAWKWLGPEFGDCDPRTIIPEHFLRIDARTGLVSGLVPRIEKEVSITERHRTIKVWRALWSKMLGSYCDGKADPSLSFANSAPAPRQAVWKRREVLQRVQRAWRMGYFGLAACMAVAWDSMLSPVDARRLTPAQCRRDAMGVMFVLDRAKTGRGAAATLSPWSLAILSAYVKRLGVELAPSAPIFRNRSGAPYSKDTLGDDFRDVREAFDPADKRQLADMRRSGAVEGDAGGGSVTDQSNKMANTVSANNRLRKTYNPVNVASVRRFDEARVKGARVLEQRPDKSVMAPDLMTLFGSGAPAKPLK
jgi:hypothetical protein